VRVMELLLGRGTNVHYSDPRVPAMEIAGKSMESVELNSGTLAGPDGVVLLVNHDDFDIPQIMRESKLLIDTRNATRGLLPQSNVVKL